MREEPNMDALVTAAQASRWFGRTPAGTPVVSRHLLGMWRRAGHIAPCEVRDGRPLYRLGDIYDVERRMAKRAWQANNHRARRVA